MSSNITHYMRMSGRARADAHRAFATQGMAVAVQGALPSLEHLDLFKQLRLRPRCLVGLRIQKQHQQTLALCSSVTLNKLVCVE